MLGRYYGCHSAERRYAECLYGNCYSAQFYYTESRYPECLCGKCYYADYYHTDCRYAECCYADCGDVVLNVALLTVIMLSVVAQSKYFFV
jgi:hypothetical protein